MSDTKDGGPAFPVQDAASWQGHGMSLRDYFAAKAMQAYVSSYPNGNTGEAEYIAADAYDMADAMLAARAAELW